MASPILITEARLIANRQNSQLSTGPRTATGKSRTRLNALRHGLTGATVLLPEEDPTAYHQHCANLIEDLAPEGAMETQVARSIADTYWRLNRIKAVEDEVFADADVTHQALAEINLLSLYEQRLNRAVHKAHAQLSELQRLRKVAQSAQPPKSGSVFSNNRITPPPDALCRPITCKSTEPRYEIPPLTQAA